MDDSLLEYYESCTRNLSSEDDGPNGVEGSAASDSDETQGQSLWRSASGDSPLRGRARLRSPKQRSDLAALKRKYGVPRYEGASSDSTVNDPQHERGEAARGVACLLAKPYGACTSPTDTPLVGTSTTAPLLFPASQAPLPFVYHTAQEMSHEAQRRESAIRDALLFDVLCALRLDETRYCRRRSAYTDTHGAPQTGAYALTEDARSLLMQRGWIPFLSALEALLASASVVAALQAEIEGFYATVHAVGRCVDISAVVGSALSDEATQGLSSAATIALGEAAFSSLCRLGVFARNVLRCFRGWVLEVQEFRAGVQAWEKERGTGRGKWQGGGAHHPSKVARTEHLHHGRPTEDAGSFGNEPLTPDTFSTSAPPLMRELLAAVEHNMVPLRRVLHIMRECACFSGLARWARERGLRLPGTAATEEEKALRSRPVDLQATVEDFADCCAGLGAGLLDYLIVRLSALQDTSTMDLYRVYMILLLHCAWPYVLLSTATICGFVHGVDPHRWRRQLPRLFRASFSHMRIGDAKTREPTDILSLMLNCIGYDEYVGRPGRGEPDPKALSALSSSRRFVLRCFASFAQKKKQLQKRERKNPPPRDDQAGSSLTTTAPPRERDSVKDMTVEEILGKLVAGAHGDEGQPWEALFLPPNVLQERRSAGRDAVGAGRGGADTSTAPWGEALTQKSVAVMFPPAIPLGFAAVDHDVPGQSAYREHMRCRELVNDLPLCSSVASMTKDDGAASEASRAALWHLRLSDHDGVPDLQLVRRSDHIQAAWYTDTVDDVNPTRRAGRRRRERDLWLSTVTPAAYWVAAALLIPMGVVVQRLQERRLELLLRRTRVQRGLPVTPFDLDVYEGDDTTDGDAAGTAGARMGSVTHSGLQRVQPPAFPASFSFLHAVKLVVDVALCRDKTRIVEGFLGRLYQEPYWWHRTAPSTKGEMGSAADTCSRLISFMFTDALRGKRYGDLVRLTVLPKEPRGSATPGGFSANDSKEHEEEEDLLLSREMLDVFASFQLHFSLPPEVALVLQPAVLSMHVPVHGGGSSAWEEQVEQSYTTFFWERRRGRYTGESEKGVGAREAQRGEPALSGLAFEDVWSYVFGYLCSLHVAQLALQEHRKALHIKDTQDHALLATLGAERREPPSAPLPPERKARKPPRQAAVEEALSRRAPLTMVSRGLGSAYFALSFAVDSLLAFTMREIGAVVYRLEHLLASHEGRFSAVQLCQGVDTLMLRLQVVCFPLRAPRPTGLKRGSWGTTGLLSAEDMVRRGINSLLAVALDPSRMPVRLLTSRSQVAIESLVTLLSGLTETSVLKTRMQPLLSILTFNRFYGWDGEVNFQFR